MQLTYELNMYIFTCRVCCNPNLLKYKMNEVVEDNPLTTFQQYYTYRHALFSTYPKIAVSDGHISIHKSCAVN